MNSFVQLQGTRIVAHIVTDGTAPAGTWVTLTGWDGYSERPAPGWQPHLINGEVVWQDESASPARLASGWLAVRAERDRLLAATDWIVTRAIERAESVPTDWATYRQALRDITEQADPFNVSWPTPPIT